jgi:hypothetical protein
MDLDRDNSIGALFRAGLVKARPWLCWLVPAAAVLCFLAWGYISLRPHFTCDDAEPEILNQAWRFARGESIYRAIDSPPYAFAAYPPLYYALAGLLMKTTGLTFLPARLLTFLSTLSVGWAMASLSRQWRQTARNGLWAAFFFLLIPAALYNAARCHVQMMALAFSVWSLVFFLRGRRMPALIISPVLAVLAFYTKQTQIALPLALVMYLMVHRRRWLLPYAATGAATGLLALFWLQKATQGAFFLDTVTLARLSYSISQIPLVFLHFAGPILLFIGLALHLLWKRWKAKLWEPIDYYLACTFLTTILFLGRLGAHGQYVLELLAVTLIFLLRTTGLPSIHGREVLVSLQVIFLLAYTPTFVLVEEGQFNMAANRAAQQIYPLLREGSRPILSQQESFSLFSRGEIYVQLFHFIGLARAGLWDQKPLLDQINNHAFSWVITQFPLEEARQGADDRERFTPEILDALRRNYRRQEAIYPYYCYRALPAP